MLIESLGVEQEVGEEAVEFDKNSGGDEHPSRCQNGSGGQIFQKVLHRNTPGLAVCFGADENRAKLIGQESFGQRIEQEAMNLALSFLLLLGCKGKEQRQIHRRFAERIG